MHFRPVVAFHSPGGERAPDLVLEFADENGMSVLPVDSCGAVAQLVNRTFPACIVFGSPVTEEALATCREIKQDAFSAVIPVVFVTSDIDEDTVAVLTAGADELLGPDMPVGEQKVRLQVTVNRADRDVSVHPSTRLPGTAQIERDIAERIRSGEKFAVCYADLDHFKEFNDRYGYNRGDGVIMTLSRILRDVVKAYAPGGFIGHIGGDDFIFNVPAQHMEVCCEEILEIFDELIPYQYTEEDRRSGHFLAKDRRGNLHSIPLMSLSIGVVTNRIRKFSHTARVSELASEMKSYAKTLTGSVYAVDRRSDKVPAEAVADSELPPDQE